MPEPVATPLSPRFYPIALRPADDPRFTFRLVSDVARVLAEHGYPEVRALDHGGLNQTLHGFLYTDAVAADEELVEALRTYRDESQRLVLLDPDDADDVTRLWLAIESESGADRPIDAEIVRAALQGLRRATFTCLRRSTPKRDERWAFRRRSSTSSTRRSLIDQRGAHCSA